MPDIDILVLVAVVLAAVNAFRGNRVVQHNSLLTGDLYYKEIMATQNVNRFSQVARMDLETFTLLRQFLMEHGGLRNSMYICAGQKLMILIYIMRGHTNRETMERWQHSGATVSAIVHEVSSSLLSCRNRIYKPAKEGDPTPTQISNFAKFSPFFDNCIGALDGTHIPAVIPFADHVRFRNRKKFVSQNVLGVANFDLTFSYALFGWEGSAHDARVYDDAKQNGLALIPNKFYLGDGGYGLSEYVLTPFRAVRYHLLEFEMHGLGPANAKELFNLRHSSLRNVVERIFGVVKRRFPILVKMSPYDYPFQVEIVECCFLLHNYVRLNQLYEDEFYDVEDGNVPNNVVEEDLHEDNEMGGNYNALKQWQIDIANAMWEQYQIALAQQHVI